ncbi:MAG: thrombospondin type 3 repeat-containing protein [Phycisphaerae bacterium]|nr:thrombospondin type 3 repeat-containing protein [Phycisphaerae bacterium]
MMLYQCRPNGRGLCSLLAVCGVVAAALVSSAYGEERKFAVLLALPTKSGVDLAELDNPNDIRDAYFDFHMKPEVDSFAEFWYEISYGTVHVSGAVFDWVEIPWAILPPEATYGGEETVDPSTLESLAGLYLPFVDLNNTGNFDKFEGEYIVQGRQMIQSDYNGELDGNGVDADGHYWEPPTVPLQPFAVVDGTEFATPGMVDFDTILGGVWTPGERFRDMNDNGVYDAFCEPTRDGWGDSSASGSLAGACCVGDGGDPEVFTCTLEPDEEACNELEGTFYVGILCTTDDDGNGTADACEGHWACCVDEVCTIESDEDACLALTGTFHVGQHCVDADSNGMIDACEGAGGWGADCPGAEAARDGVIDSGEYCDLDDDSNWDFPEPFEDFLRVYLPEGYGGGETWAKLDPSYKNEDPVSRAWAEAYIRANYPGYAGEPVRFQGDTNACGILGRFGNDRYDGPDWWFEGSNTGSKMQQNAFTPYLPNAITPKPSDGYFGLFAWDFEAWWTAYWNDKHTMYNLDPGITAPLPEWEELIPNLEEFDPDGQIAENGLERRFEPNCGGTTARAMQDGVDYGYALDTNPRCADGGANMSDPGTGCGDMDLRPEEDWNPGDGSGDDDSKPILPDELDTNEDGHKDWYDGPAEFDDLPSSMYHRAYDSNISGLFYGGDGRLGEVTSPAGFSPWGHDIGGGNPNNPSGPDGIIPAGGPLAYNVHGTNGYDAGNVLNLEFMTWRREPLNGANALTFREKVDITDPITATIYKFYGADTLWNRLVTIAVNSTATPPTADWNGVNNDTMFWDPSASEWSGIKMSAIALDIGGGTLYGICAREQLGVAENYLVTINTTSGEATLLEDPPIPIQTWDWYSGEWVDFAFPVQDMDYDSTTGLLWVLTDFYGIADLWIVNRATNKAIYEFPVGFSMFGASGLAYGGDDGAYPILYTRDEAWEALATINFDPGHPDGYDLGDLIPTTNPPEDLKFQVVALTFEATGSEVIGADPNDHLFKAAVTEGKGTDFGYLGFSKEFSQAMKRDFNLDGLLDLGEVRAAGTENYVIDEYTMTANDGGPAGRYPFNRRRLTEDIVAALDASVDWDEVIMTVGQPPDVTGYVHSTFIIPAGTTGEASSAGGRPLFVLPAPGMNLPIQVREQPGTTMSPLKFSDFGTPMDGSGETGGETQDYQKQLMSHEWLHVWEGYPDLYDYDEYSPTGPVINHPVGAWDIMSGAWVHPTPPLKQSGVGNAGLGTDHLPWIEVQDLTEVINPMEETQVTLYDYAFNPTNSVYVFKNPNALTYAYDATDTIMNGELYYFWRVTHHLYPYPNWRNFSLYGPGEGMLIMHTDFGENLEGAPQQQRIGSHFGYNIVQADGLQQLEAGENYGDSGDPFPGAFFVTQWDEGTDPNSNWWGGHLSGLEIRNIVEYDDHSVITFYWHLRSVPELEFNRPPGETVIGPNLILGFKAFDFYAGTEIEFYYDTDDADYDGTQFPGVLHKSPPGLAHLTYPVDISSVPDGEYYFYARLKPGEGIDEQWELEFSDPRPDVVNHGRGHLEDSFGVEGIEVDKDAQDRLETKLEKWTITCIDHTTPGAEVWQVEGSLSGVQATPATTDVLYTFNDNEGGIQFKIEYDPEADTEQGNVSLVYDGSAYTTLTDDGANFVASDFKAGDYVRIIGGAGAIPGFFTITNVPSTTSLQLVGNAGDAATGVTYWVHAFSNNGGGAGAPDRFHFMTTGKTPYSLPITLLNGDVVPRVYPVVEVSYPEDDTNPGRRAPLRVRFDAAQSLDENGEPNEDLVYAWNFGDPDSPDPTSDQAVIEHVYSDEQFPGPDPVTVTATLDLTIHQGEPEEIVSVETVEIVVSPPFYDADQDGIQDSDDNCPFIFNPNQDNSDGDTLGDVCDNCPNDDNENQSDLDGDGLGDACDDDIDGDGVLNVDDNCPEVPNAPEPGEDQPDLDGDGEGDACDWDIDGDTVANGIDNCPVTPNTDQADADGDGLGNACDACPFDLGNDADGDGICGDVDNCPTIANPDQSDTDLDGIGDACDHCLYDPYNDIDDDGLCGNMDNCPNIANPDQADADLDGIGDACDICPNDPENDADGDGICGTPDDTTDETDTTSDTTETPETEPPTALRPPTEPSSPYPSDGAADMPTDVRLDWSDSERVEMYRVIVGPDMALNTKFLNAGTTASQWNANLNLREGRTYYWQVIAENDAGSTEGPIWSFTTVGTASPEPDVTQEQPEDETTAEDEETEESSEETSTLDQSLKDTGLCPATAASALLFTLFGLWTTRSRARNARRRADG